jgi:hypothetical protein
MYFPPPRVRRLPYSSTMPPRQPDRETLSGTEIGARGATIAELQDAMTAGTLSSADLTAC